MFDRCVAPVLGETPLEQIDRAMLQRFFNGLKTKNDEPLAPRSQKLIRHLISGILNLAVVDKLITENPAKSLRLPKVMPSENKQIGAVGLKTLLDNSEGELHEFIKLCGIGLRMGEALGAGSQSITGDVLKVEQQIQMDKKGRTRLQKTLKTEAGRRDIPLPFDMPQALFFCTLKPPQAQYQLRKLSDKFEMGEVYPHALRKTFITVMEDELECPRRIVQEIVGHRRPEVTDVYSKVSMDAKRRWMKKYWEHISTSRVVQLTTEQAI